MFTLLFSVEQLYFNNYQQSMNSALFVLLQTGRFVLELKYLHNFSVLLSQKTKGGIFRKVKRGDILWYRQAFQVFDS